MAAELDHGNGGQTFATRPHVAPQGPVALLLQEFSAMYVLHKRHYRRMIMHPIQVSLQTYRIKAKTKGKLHANFVSYVPWLISQSLLWSSPVVSVSTFS
jgi:hypothetical protein